MHKARSAQMNSLFGFPNIYSSNRRALVIDWKTPWRSSGENIVTFREAQNCEKTWAGCLNSEVFLSQNILILFFAEMNNSSWIIMTHSGELTHGTLSVTFPPDIFSRRILLSTSFYLVRFTKWWYESYDWLVSLLLSQWRVIHRIIS